MILIFVIQYFLVKIIAHFFHLWNTWLLLCSFIISSDIILQLIIILQESWLLDKSHRGNVISIKMPHYEPLLYCFRVIFSKDQAILAKKILTILKFACFHNYIHIMDKMKFVKYFCQILFCSAIMAIWNSDRSASKMLFFINANFGMINLTKMKIVRFDFI